MNDDPFFEEPYSKGISFRKRLDNFNQFSTLKVKSISSFWPGMFFLFLGLIVLLIPKLIILLIAGLFFISGFSLILSHFKK